MSGPAGVTAPLATLRAFVRARPRPVAAGCELCRAPLDDAHAHLFELEGRQLRCACTACGLLFTATTTARYRRVEPRAERLDAFRLDEAAWARLGLPIGIAFFVRSDAGEVSARFPGPAGATQCHLAAADWQALVDDNPVLATLAPEVEALLVHRIGAARDHYHVSIDECFRLVGLVRRHWRGLSGGSEVQAALATFFAELGR